MKVLYMNQGGGGHWGAIKYSEYDIILLAESTITKTGFEMNWTSQDSLPPMSVQLAKRDSPLRLITEVSDLDVTAQTVRPLLTFTVVEDRIRVVFVHLKSANAKAATEALKLAVAAVEKRDRIERPTLWIGDFNRADEDVIPDATALFVGGGQSWWDLDRAYITGDWSGFKRTVSIPATAGADHNHAAIAVEIEAA